MPHKPPLVERYLNEIIDYGGEPYTRAEVILDMKRIGISQSGIDRWFQGYELGKRLQNQRETRSRETCATQKQSNAE